MQPALGVLDFRIVTFEFVSVFDIRASNLNPKVGDLVSFKTKARVPLSTPEA